ncbi:MAG: cupin domain-containing protein [Acidobacteria bacterium]|nr:cupin domain-containing protein [Acidobacteriota bacterium]
MSRKDSANVLSEDTWMRALGVDDAGEGNVAPDASGIEELLAAELLIGEMAFADLATPPASLRDRLLAQVAAEAPVSTPAVPFVLRNDDSPWDETGIPGVRRRNLFVDESTQRASFLIKMDPGAKYPPHRHVGVEECFILTGTVRDDAMQVGAGDYVRYETSSDHTPLWTVDGCVLLIVGPVMNERL